MLSDAMKYADATTYEAAEVLGLPPVNRFFAVTLPLIFRRKGIFTTIRVCSSPAYTKLTSSAATKPISLI